MENSVAQSNTTVVSIQDDTQINSLMVYEYVKKEKIDSEGTQPHIITPGDVA